MPRWVWLFECLHCGLLEFLCPRCSRRRRYCAWCARRRRRASLREAGRRYQQREQGRQRHRERPRRYARRCKERRARRLPAGPVLPARDDPASAANPAPPTEMPPPDAVALPCVTHQLIRVESGVFAMVDSTPGHAAGLAHESRGAEETNDEQPREVACGPDGARAARQLGGLARAAALAAALLAFLAMEQRRSASPLMARCSSCGRVGEIMFSGGRPVVVRGLDDTCDSG